jgi:hypothetical protein
MTELLPSDASHRFDFDDTIEEVAIMVSAALAGSKKGTGASVNIGPGDSTMSPLSATEAQAESTEASTSSLPKRLIEELLERR